MTERPASSAANASEASSRRRASDPALAAELARALGVSSTLAQLLLLRGIDHPDAARAFLEPTLAGLTLPDSMRDRDLATQRLADAVRRKERVVVYGDYDVDGTTSAAILADVLEALGAEVHAELANRFEGGYGLSDRALDRCLEARPTVLVTCDCGSSDHERIARARKLGVDVVVIDHHLVPPEPLPANAFLNPHRPECAFPYKGMSSAGLAFSVAAGIRAALGAKLDVRPWLDLVALGTIADVAPLDGDNRRLVRAGLERMSNGALRPGLAALFEAAGLRAGQPLGGTDVAFRLAPRINAPGRLGDPRIVLELLRARDAARGRALAAEVERTNTERRAIERRMTEEAIARVVERHGDRPEHGVVVASEGFHRGVVGITAARLVDRFGVPAVVIALDDGVGHGSGRTIGGFDLHAAFVRCAPCLSKFGGHAAAAGLTVRADRVEELAEAFAASTIDARGHGDARPRPEAELFLGGPFAVPTATELRRLEPVGERNPSPRFGVRAKVQRARRVGQGEHLKLSLEVDGRELSAFGPGMGEKAPTTGATIALVGTLRPDAFRGGEAVELTIEHFDAEPV